MSRTSHGQTKYLELVLPAKIGKMHFMRAEEGKGLSSQILVRCVDNGLHVKHLGKHFNIKNLIVGDAV